MLGIKNVIQNKYLKRLHINRGVSVTEVKNVFSQPLMKCITAMTQMCKLNFQVILERNDLHQKNTFIRWQQN